MKKYTIEKPEAEWKKQLTDKEYKILREKDTEAPHTGKYNLHFEVGVYVCKGCNTKLFESNTKFDAGCGWPSFDEAIKGAIEYQNDDNIQGHLRTEILCAKCGSHLGHIFDDGITDTGKRYCANSVAMDFNKDS